VTSSSSLGGSTCIGGASGGEVTTLSSATGPCSRGVLSRHPPCLLSAASFSSLRLCCRSTGEDGPEVRGMSLEVVRAKAAQEMLAQMLDRLPPEAREELVQADDLPAALGWVGPGDDAVPEQPTPVVPQPAGASSRQRRTRLIDNLMTRPAFSSHEAHRALPPATSRAGRPAPSRCSESLDSPSSRDDQPRKADLHVSMVSPHRARDPPGRSGDKSRTLAQARMACRPSS